MLSQRIIVVNQICLKPGGGHMQSKIKNFSVTLALVEVVFLFLQNLKS